MLQFQVRHHGVIVYLVDTTKESGHGPMRIIRKDKSTDVWFRDNGLHLNESIKSSGYVIKVVGVEGSDYFSGSKEGIMSLRFRKSVKLIPGVRLNFNKDSMGVSFGVPGMRYTMNTKGRRTFTTGIPGTGLYNVETLSSGAKTPRQAMQEAADGVQSC
jgi:hypothetical protein